MPNIDLFLQLSKVASITDVVQQNHALEKSDINVALCQPKYEAQRVAESGGK